MEPGWEVMVALGYFPALHFLTSPPSPTQRRGPSGWHPPHPHTARPRRLHGGQALRPMCLESGSPFFSDTGDEPPPPVPAWRIYHHPRPPGSGPGQTPGSSGPGQKPHTLLKIRHLTSRRACLGSGCESTLPRCVSGDPSLQPHAEQRGWKGPRQTAGGPPQTQRVRAGRCLTGNPAQGCPQAPPDPAPAPGESQFRNQPQRTRRLPCRHRAGSTTTRRELGRRPVLGAPPAGLGSLSAGRGGVGAVPG